MQYGPNELGFGEELGARFWESVLVRLADADERNVKVDGCASRVQSCFFLYAGPFICIRKMLAVQYTPLS